MAFSIHITSFQLKSFSRYSSRNLLKRATSLNAKTKKDSSKGFGKTNKKFNDNQALFNVTSTDASNSQSELNTLANSNLPIEIFSNEESMPMTVSNPSKTKKSSSSKDTSSKLKTQDEVFAKYGIKDGDTKGSTTTNNKNKKSNEQSSSMEESAFGKKVLEKIPAQTQAKFDSALITLTFISLSFVVITGLFVYDQFLINYTNLNNVYIYIIFTIYFLIMTFDRTCHIFWSF